MRRLLAVVLAFFLWMGFVSTPSASASPVLVPCKESPAFLQRAKSARNTTADPQSGKKRFERYSEALCGPEGLPHLIVDGSLSHAGDFLIPSLLFLYIAGWIGWVGRSYLIAVRKLKDSELKEVIIDIPLAISKMLTGPLWPLLALKEITTGEMFAKDEEIPVSPR